MKEITQEQKEQLLNLNDSRVNEILGVKKLEVGKWYIYKNGSLQFNIKEGIGYGLRQGNKWINEVYWLRGDYSDTFREATHEEVENALIAEAKRRGFVNIGDLSFTSVDGFETKIGHFETGNNEYSFCIHWNILRLDGVSIFENGKWAEVIEKPNKQEIINQINELLNQL